MKTVILTLALISSVSFGKEMDCDKNPVYCDIVTLKPSINKEYAMKLSNYIVKYSKLFGTNPKHSVAIAMQESSFINQNRKTKVLKNNKVILGATDIGVFQLHVDTLQHMNELGWKIDYERLLVDIEYQTALHVRWLKKRIQTCSSERIRNKRKVEEGTEWACYHSYTPSKRAIYIKDVGRHLNKIENESQIEVAQNEEI